VGQFQPDSNIILRDIAETHTAGRDLVQQHSSNSGN
jgi:hypothetical protein